MKDHETLTIDLPSGTARLLQTAVASGEYASASAVVDAALQSWDAQRGLLGYSPDEIQRLADDGIASGPGSLSLAQIKREALREAGFTPAGV